MRYKKSLLLAQQALLNATKNELSSKTTAEINNTLQEIKRSLSDLRDLVKNGVDKLLHMEVECFTRVNLTVCADIINGHTAFRFLLQEVSEHFAQAEYLKSILEGRSDSVQEIERKLSKIFSDLITINAQITKAGKAETAESIDATTSTDTNVIGCPGAKQLKFAFDSRQVDTDLHCQESGNGTRNCIDIEVPINATSTNLWNIHSCPVDSELKSFKVFDNFTKLMNSVPVKISASLLKVTVNRRWFDRSIFENVDHFTMVGINFNLSCFNYFLTFTLVIAKPPCLPF